MDISIIVKWDIFVIFFCWALNPRFHYHIYTLFITSSSPFHYSRRTHMLIFFTIGISLLLSSSPLTYLLLTIIATLPLPTSLLSSSISYFHHFTHLPRALSLISGEPGGVLGKARFESDDPEPFVLHFLTSLSTAHSVVHRCLRSLCFSFLHRRRRL